VQGPYLSVSPGIVRHAERAVDAQEASIPSPIAGIITPFSIAWLGGTSARPRQRVQVQVARGREITGAAYRDLSQAFSLGVFLPLKRPQTSIQITNEATTYHKRRTTYRQRRVR
jgi:hypothetical protein